MNNKLAIIYEAFPYFNDGFFYISTPDGHFEDPEDQIQIQIYGEQFKVTYSGPGEYSESIYDTPEEVIQNVNQWLDAYNGNTI